MSILPSEPGVGKPQVAIHTHEVIADPETGWRTVVANRRGRSLNPQLTRRLAAIEKKLQAEYTLSADQISRDAESGLVETF